MILSRSSDISIQQITTAVFPVAGIGSRFLPSTKASPKEMLPIVDKPLIQYAVEEAIRAGITHMIFITSSSKRAIEDHFDKNYELEMRLHKQCQHDLLALVNNISPPGVQFTYVRQQQPLGLGHAILCAEHVVGNEPFLVLLADDLIDNSTVPCLATMLEYFTRDGNSIIAVQSVDWEDVHKYGVVNVVDSASDYARISGIMEKPAKDTVTSNLVAIGRYLFTADIFHCLKQVQVDNRGEIQLSDGIQLLLTQAIVQSYYFHGKRYDCGSKLGYLQATVEFGLQHPEIGCDFMQYLQKFLGSTGIPGGCRVVSRKSSAGGRSLTSHGVK